MIARKASVLYEKCVHMCVQVHRHIRGTSNHEVERGEENVSIFNEEILYGTRV